MIDWFIELFVEVKIQCHLRIFEAVCQLIHGLYQGTVSLLDGTLQTEMAAIFTHLVLYLTIVMTFHTNKKYSVIC